MHDLVFVDTEIKISSVENTRSKSFDSGVALGSWQFAKLRRSWRDLSWTAGFARPFYFRMAHVVSNRFSTGVANVSLILDSKTDAQWFQRDPRL